MGVWIRAMAIYDIPGEYAFIRQGHSHVAFLGWAYLGLAALLVDTFLPTGSLQRKKYKWNLRLTAFFIGAMLFSFPILGYKAISITLLTLFLVISCVFCYHFLKDYRQTKPKGVSRFFVNAAFFFYLLSGIGPFALGPIVVMIGKGDIYHLAVYYYLHFLYNGFFVFAIFALMSTLKSSKSTNNPALEKSKNHFFKLTLFACIPAYALSTLWLQPNTWVFFMGILAASLQLFSLVYLRSFLRHIEMNIWAKRLLIFSLLAYALKIILQFSSSASWVADKVYQAKSYLVIGYLHLVTIGFISLFLLAWSIHKGYFSVKSTGSKIGLWLFLTGFISSEVLLFVKGLLHLMNSNALTNFHGLLFTASTLMPLGLLLFGATARQQSK